MGCCVEREDGATPGSGGSSEVIVEEGLVLAELYFDQMATGAIVDGALTIPSSVGDLPFTAVNSANAATWAFTNGVGLQFAQPNGVAGTLTTVAQTSPYIFTTLADLPTFQWGPNLLLQFHVSAYTAGPTTVNDGPCSGLWRLANDPLANAPGPNGLFYGFRRSNTAGVDMVVFNRTNAAVGTGLPDVDVEGVFDVAMMTTSQNGLPITAVGTRTAGVWSPGNQIQVGTATVVGWTEATRWLFGAQWAASGAPTLAFTVPRARLIRL